MAPTELDLDDVAVFVEIVDAGGISAAAASLHRPKSSVSRCLARLERRLGTRLLERTTRSMTLTDAGRAFHERTSSALAEVRVAVLAAFDAREVPRGTVRLAAPPDVGAEVLPALLTAFTAAHPEVRVDLHLSAGPGGPGVPVPDLALRVGPPVERGQVGVHLQDMVFRLYAAPDYLRRAGTPERGDQLAGHECVVFRADDGRARWLLHHRSGPAAGPRVDVVVRGRLACDDISVARRAAIAGAGIALLPRVTGEAAVERGALRPVLPDHETASSPLYLAYPARAHVPLAVRALRDHLLRAFPR